MEENAYEFEGRKPEYHFMAEASGNGSRGGGAAKENAASLWEQYVRVKGSKGKTYTYHDIKKMYVIIIFEQSMGIFHKMGERYIHHGETRFDTGLTLKLLQEFYLVALDVFRKTPYPRDRSERTAWLYTQLTMRRRNKT